MQTGPASPVPVTEDVATLRSENAELRRRIADAEQTLHAIRTGEIDAIVVDSATGPKAYTLRDAYEPYRQIVEQMHEAALTITASGLILYCNDALAYLVHRLRAELPATDFSDFVTGADIVALTARSGNPGYDITVHRSDGTKLDCRASSAPLQIDGEPVYCCVITNLSRQRLRLRHDSLVRAASHAILTLSPNLVVETWNAGAVKLYGYSPVEIIGRSFRQVCPEGAFAELDEVIHRAGQYDEPVEAEIVQRRKDGRLVDVFLSLTRLNGRAGLASGYAAIAHDISERLRAERAMHESNARLQLALDAAQLGWWHYDPVTNRVAWDARYRRLLDLDSDAGDMLSWLRLIDNNHVDAFSSTVLESISSTTRVPFSLEHRITRGDGTQMWIVVHGMPESSRETNKPGRRVNSLVGTIADITERKLREEHMQLLLGEVNHRSKNILAVVLSIARQTSGTADRDFIQRFSERIQSLAAGQDLMIKSQWKGVHIDELVHTQLGHFADLIGSRISVRGVPLRLSAPAAQCIGMALHELSTNASKYGALSNDKGRIEIRGQIYRIDGKAERFKLTWQESGGPAVALPDHRGFGSIVTGKMLKMMLAADVSMDFPTSGFTWSCDCPVDNVVEPALSMRH